MSCLHESSSADRFCGECGEALPRLICRCGAANDTEHKFCVSCGFDLKEERGAIKTEVDKAKFKLKDFLVAAEPMTVGDDTNRSVSQDDIDKLMR